MKLRVFVGLVAVMCLGVAGIAAYVMRPPKGRITQEACDVIQVGWSKKQVYVLLGSPGDYRRSPRPFSHVEFVGIEGELKEWLGDAGWIFLWFDDQGRVLNKEFLETVSTDESLVQKVLRWLSL
jgi:hypothetical protein